MPEPSPPDGRGQPVIRLLLMGLLLFVLVGYLSQHLLPVSAAVSDSPGVVGRLVDPQGEPVRNAEVVVYLDGGEQSVAAEESQADGSFILDLPSAPIESLRLDIARPHFQSTTWTAGPDALALLRQGATVRLPDITLERRITPGFWIATLTSCLCSSSLPWRDCIIPWQRCWVRSSFWA